MRRHVIWKDTEPVSTILVGRDMTQILTEMVSGNGHRQIAVICQPSTFALAETYANAFHVAGIEVGGYTLPDGEEAKRLGVVEDVYRFLNARHFTRDDLVVGVGGGALTDVTGFIAGTYLRGVSAMYVATTLLASVDAAIGGKTGVNVDGKNLAGVFSHPEAVIIDVDILDALPREQKINGAAEAIKTGFIADTEIIAAFENDGIDTDLEDVVNRSVTVKTRVVNEDFTERGARAILNYGHTIGHAIETTTGRPHGESVAIGMVAAGHASRHHLGFSGADRQSDILAFIGLPVTAPEAKLAPTRAAMAFDKKRDSKGLRMVLLEDFGSPVLIHPDDATVRAAFAGIDLV